MSGTTEAISRDESYALMRFAGEGFGVTADV